MLKRTLTIGVLTILTLCMVASAPPGEAASPQGETTIYYELDDGTQAVLFWFEAAPTDSPAVLTTGPDYDPIDIPESVLATLPSHVRGAFEGTFTDPLAQSVNGCVVAADPPWVSGTKAKGRVDISCIATNVVETRLEGELQRNNNVIDDYDSGWRTWMSHGQTLSDSCGTGTYSFKTYAKGSIKFNNGTVSTKTTAATRTLTC